MVKSVVSIILEGNRTLRSEVSFSRVPAPCEINSRSSSFVNFSQEFRRVPWSCVAYIISFPYTPPRYTILGGDLRGCVREREREGGE